MSIMFVKRSELPVPRLGKEASNSVVIGGNGQFIMSTIASKFFDGSEQVFMAFDAYKAFIFRQDAPIVEKAIKTNKLSADGFYKLRKAKKGNFYAFSAGTLLANLTKYGVPVAYDYKGSGNQTFATEWDSKNMALTFTLPTEGKMVPKPVVHREKKVKAAGTVANPGSVAGTPVNGATGNLAAMKEDDLVLDAA